MVDAEAPSLLLAFVPGLASFVSPCCLPLVPGYLATVAGLDPADRTRRVDPAVIARAGLFVGTFSLLFIVLGLTATALGAFLFDNQPTLNKAAGVAIVLMGALFAASAFVPALARSWHPERLSARAGSGGPVVAGAAFALAWTPCVGPTLGAILGLSATQGTAGQGAALLAVYSAGLAVPFLATLTDRVDAEFLDRAGPQLKVVSNYAVGFDNIVVPEATARGVAIGNTPGALTETTADLAFPAGGENLMIDFAGTGGAVLLPQNAVATTPSDAGQENCGYCQDKSAAPAKIANKPQTTIR